MMRDRAHLRGTLENKARELFSLCDPEGKGYAIKNDLQTLRCELPLPPEQLDIVFDALDANSDGKLTLQEFTDGFGLFLGIDTLPNNGATEIDKQAENEEDEEILEELLDHLGARNLFTDEDYVREMWRRVRKEDPVMRSNFENFISKMAADLKESALEQTSLHNTLKNRKQEHENQVQTLYVEMEEQLKAEKEKILAEEQRKEQKMRNELETELQLKDQQLSELLAKHAQMEHQLAELDSMNSEKKYDNVKLQKDRDMLESRLSASEKMLQEMKNSLALLRKRSLEEKRARAQAALKVSEGIALERENLVLELHHLKEVNKQLQDEKDELVQTTAQTVQQLLANSASPSLKRVQLKPEGKESSERSNDPLSISDKDIKVEKSETKSKSSSRERIEELSHPLKEYNSNSLGDDHASPYVETQIKSLNTIGVNAYVEEEVSTDTDIQNNLNIPPSKKKDSTKYDKNSNAPRDKSLSTSGRRMSPRISPPVLKKILPIKKSSIDEGVPTRLFKVVFVGDSGVGKTSILQRFCTNNFKTTYSATVGVDFQIKNLEVDGERIALQLWDTAGQERYRSITQQYFRRSDGIIVVYDVTCETSFKNVRSWMNSIQEGTTEETTILILGNKIDLCEKDSDRVVRTKDGARIADEYGTLFYETSAKTGDSIREAIEGLACILKTKEDENMEQVLRLQEEEEKKKKSKCC